MLNIIPPSQTHSAAAIAKHFTRRRVSHEIAGKLRAQARPDRRAVQSDGHCARRHDRRGRPSGQRVHLPVRPTARTVATRHGAHRRRHPRGPTAAALASGLTHESPSARPTPVPRHSRCTRSRQFHPHRTWRSTTRTRIRCVDVHARRLSIVDMDVCSLDQALQFEYQGSCGQSTCTAAGVVEILVCQSSIR